jgi:hypothetical protein
VLALASYDSYSFPLFNFQQNITPAPDAKGQGLSLKVESQLCFGLRKADDSGFMSRK